MAAVASLAAGLVVGLSARAQDDAALRTADAIATLVASFPSFRAEHRHGSWTDRPDAVWSVRSTAGCHAALDEAGVPFLSMPESALPIPAPVRVTGAVGGVVFRKLRRARPLVVACELAGRLPAIAAVLARHRVTEVRVLSAWRRVPRTSFHTMGLALDLSSFVRDDGSVLDVETDFVVRETGPTCEGEPPLAEHAAALRSIACDLGLSGAVSTVVTPAYSEGHRDHLHIDVRPDDARIFVR